MARLRHLRAVIGRSLRSFANATVYYWLQALSVSSGEIRIEIGIGVWSLRESRWGSKLRSEARETARKS